MVGGAGNFGARIVRALRADPSIELLVAGRRIVSVPAAEDVPGESLSASIVRNRTSGKRSSDGIADGILNTASIKLSVLQ